MQHDDSFARARRALLLDHVFFGSLVMHLLPIMDPDAKKGLWIDAVHVGYNPETFNALDLPEAAGLLAKGVLHCALQHPLRRGRRDKELWQQACDYVTNPIVLSSDDLKLPAGALVDSQYAEMGAEQVYALLELQQQQQQQQQQKQPGQQGGQGAGSGPGKKPAQGSQNGQGTPQPPQTGEVRDLPGQDGQAPSADECGKVEQEWKVGMQQALQNAASRGNLPGALQRLITKELEPRVDWRNETRRFINTVSKDDQTWARPNRRFIATGVYLPAIHSERLGLIVVVNDTSGSTQAAQEVFLAEMQAICEDVRPERIMYVQQDTRIRSVDELEPGEPFDRNMQGGGGTDFRPVFKYLDDAGIIPACMVFLTDLDGPFPDEEPPYPVLWAAVGRTQEAPFGDVVKLDIALEK